MGRSSALLLAVAMLAVLAAPAGAASSGDVRRLQRYLRRWDRAGGVTGPTAGG